MEKTGKCYAAFERAMDEEKIYRVLADFDGICVRIGADPALLDRMIYEELGWTGQSLVDLYRSQEGIW